MDKWLEVSPVDRRRIWRELQQCVIFRFPDPGYLHMASEYQKDLEQGIRSYKQGVTDDVLFQSLQRIELFDTHEELMYFYDLVCSEAMRVTIQVHEELQVQANFMRHMHKKIKSESFLRGDTAQHLLELDGLNEDSLYSVLSDKFGRLKIESELTDPNLSGALGESDPSKDQISMYPLSILMSIVARNTNSANSDRLYRVSAKALFSVYGLTFLHELVHVIQPCMFEYNTLDYILRNPSSFNKGEGLSDEEVDAYRGLMGHCLRFRLALLYMVQENESEIAKVRPEIFQSVKQSILNEREVIYNGYENATGYAAWLIRLIGLQSPSLLEFPQTQDTFLDSYIWESELYDKIDKLTSLKAPVFIRRSEIRQTVGLSKEIRDFIRDRPRVRPNYAESYGLKDTSSTWDVGDFVFTLDGEANLYLAIEDGQDPLSLFTEMLLYPAPEKTNRIPLDLVGIYLVSNEDENPTLIYSQEGFRQKEITFEEAWWLLQ